MLRKAVLACAVGALSIFGLSQATQAANVQVGLELALLVDVSGSVDANEFLLQQQGYVSAFHSPAVKNAIAGGQLGSIAVTLMYWSSTGVQQQSVGWTLINDAASADAFANAINAAARPFQGNTD